MTRPVIAVDGLHAGYRSGLDILHDIQIEVDEQEIVTVVGANGAGKSTLLKAIMGWVPFRQGNIRFQEHDLLRLRPYHVSRLGIGYVPQLENVFPSMTVDENLDLGAGKLRSAQARSRKDRIKELFPDLSSASNRAAGLLSGGQRQMLAMGRALMSEPSMILLDEPTAGLAPGFVDLLFQQILEVRNTGVTILMVEQNARRALEISDRGYVFDLGRNRFTGPGKELLNNPEIIDAYLGTADDEARA